jgi:D-tyrosyl-tRNA(Tyr) deacylase
MLKSRGMRAVVQRVSRAEVRVDDTVVGTIGRGCCVLLGVAATDAPADVTRLADKIVGLRIFDDAAGRMNQSIEEIAGALLVVSQFTLYADCRRGRRPSFTGAAAPADAERLYRAFVTRAAARVPVATGRFGARMAVSLEGDGPVTLVLDSAELA